MSDLDTIDEHGSEHVHDDSTDVRASAILSPDGLYRYQLARIWSDSSHPMLWIMLNPSTADHVRNDPTITRCIGFAREWGQPGLVVRNLFARRATEPRDLRPLDDAGRVGPHGDHYLLYGLRDFVRPAPPDEPYDDRWRPLVVCAWGAMASLGPWAQARAEHVLRELAARDVPVFHLGLTSKGRPAHPLMLTRDRQPTRWDHAQVTT